MQECERRLYIQLTKQEEDKVSVDGWPRKQW